MDMLFWRTGGKVDQTASHLVDKHTFSHGYRRRLTLYTPVTTY
jgi:hypothetical protein